MADSRVVSCKRKIDASEKATVAPLMLHVVPEAAKAKRPRRGPHPVLVVGEDNQAWASVNGQRVRVLLDSGTTLPMLFMPLARRLGLVRGGEATRSMKVCLWSGVTHVQVTLLPEVVLVLEGGLELRTPATVFPEDMAVHYDPELVVLDVNSMRRGHMQQRFHRGGSCIAVRRPAMLRRLPEGRTRNKVLTLQARQPGQADAPLKMLLDTGCTNFAVSRPWLRETGASRPRDVFLRLGHGRSLHARQPSTQGTVKYHLVMGRALLRRYAAVVDYRSLTVSFRVGGTRMKLPLTPA